jgi:hypothetical protein
MSDTPGCYRAHCTHNAVDSVSFCANPEPISAPAALKSKTVSRGYAKYTPELTERQLKLRDGIHGMSRSELKRHMASFSGGTDEPREESD